MSTPAVPLRARVRVALRRNPALRAGVNLLRHRDLEAADALLVSYPKSGNTWLKFMVVHALTGGAPGFDGSEEVVATVGRHQGTPALLPEGGRIVKSHEAWSAGVRAPGPVVYVVRDGRDVAVSYYHHLLRRGPAPAAFSSFLPRFIAGEFDGYGPWATHVTSWLDGPMADDGRLLMLRYEDLLEDPAAGLRQALEFLGVAADADVEAAVEANRFEQMRRRETESAFHEKQGDRFFVRRGVSGEWRETFSEADAALFERACGAVLERLGYVG